MNRLLAFGSVVFLVATSPIWIGAYVYGAHPIGTLFVVISAALFIYAATGGSLSGLARDFFDLVLPGGRWFKKERSLMQMLQAQNDLKLADAGFTKLEAPEVWEAVEYVRNGNRVLIVCDWRDRIVSLSVATDRRPGDLTRLIDEPLPSDLSAESGRLCSLFDITLNEHLRQFRI